MIIKNVNLETVCGVTSTLPVHDQPEFAFAGKSNVGKSSLINGIMRRKNYARKSTTPGKTITINFYKVNDEFYLVDLPGYGYAKRSKEDVAKWGGMIENYLHHAPMLKQVFLLIDMRHEPNENDRMMYDWIVAQGFQPIIVATKADKINKSQFQNQINMLRKSLNLPEDGLLLPYSALTKQGLEDIYAVLDQKLES